MTRSATGASIVDDEDELIGGSGSGLSNLSFLRLKNRDAVIVSVASPTTEKPSLTFLFHISALDTSAKVDVQVVVNCRLLVWNWAVPEEARSCIIVRTGRSWWTEQMNEQSTTNALDVSKLFTFASETLHLERMRKVTDGVGQVGGPTEKAVEHHNGCVGSERTMNIFRVVERETFR